MGEQKTMQASSMTDLPNGALLKCTGATELFASCTEPDDVIGVVREGEQVMYLGERGLYGHPDFEEPVQMKLIYVLTPSGVGWVPVTEFALVEQEGDPTVK